MQIRQYKSGDERALWAIFYHTIHQVNTHDYNQQQINAWAPENFNPEIWLNKIRTINPFVAVIHDKVIAYADLQKNGLIDHFFCHHQWQRQGVGTLLMKKIHSEATASGINTLHSDVSITAKPFYLAHGFSVVQKQTLSVRGQTLNNYLMRKQLSNFIAKI